MLFEVMALGLHNSLYAMTGAGLDRFVPKDYLTAGGHRSVQNIQLSEDVDTRPMLKSCMDEEACGFKAMNFLAGPCGLRVYPEPEGSHPQWNDFLRAITEAQLKPTLLKATLLCNWTRGPFGSGTNQCRLADSASDLMSRKGTDVDYMAHMNELIMKDRGLTEFHGITPEEWIKICEKRIPKARGKAWFGICDSFSQLDRNWTILSETVTHIATLQRLLKATCFCLIYYLFQNHFHEPISILMSTGLELIKGALTLALVVLNVLTLRTLRKVFLTMMMTWAKNPPHASNHKEQQKQQSWQPHGGLFHFHYLQEKILLARLATHLNFKFTFVPK